MKMNPDNRDPIQIGETLLRFRTRVPDLTLSATYDLLYDGIIVEQPIFKSNSDRSRNNDRVLPGDDKGRETPLHDISTNGRGK